WFHWASASFDWACAAETQNRMANIVVKRSAGSRFPSPQPLSRGERGFTPFFRGRSAGSRFPSPQPLSRGERGFTPFFRGRSAGSRFPSPQPLSRGERGFTPFSRGEKGSTTPLPPGEG